MRVTPSSIVVGRFQWDTILFDLLSTPDLERAGVCFAGVRTNGKSESLLLRDWMPVPKDEYLVQLGHHLEVSPVFWARVAKRSRQTGEAVVVIHSHPHDPKVPRFSPSDDGGEDVLFPKMVARAQVPFASIVVSPGGCAARITRSLGRREAIQVKRVGDSKSLEGARRQSEFFDRQVRALGRSGQTVLAESVVGIVGAGGIGSQVIQQLAHLGIGRIVVVDPDRVSMSNLSRLVGASRIDAVLRRKKVHVSKRLIRRLRERNSCCSNSSLRPLRVRSKAAVGLRSDHRLYR